MINKKLTITILIGLLIIPTLIPANSVAHVQKNYKFCKTSNLNPGDIVFCEIRTLWKMIGGHDVKKGFDHVALYMGKGHVLSGKFIEDNIFGKHYVLEATFYPFPKVRYTRLSLLKIYSHVYFGRVIEANETVRNKALDFAQSQLGCSYQNFGLMPKKDNPCFPWDYTVWDENNPCYKFRKHANFNPDDPDDPLSDWYYCADLVWASYYNAGIDLDPKYPEDLNHDEEIDMIEGYGPLRYVSPQNIWDSSNTTQI